MADTLFSSLAQQAFADPMELKTIEKANRLKEKKSALLDSLVPKTNLQDSYSLSDTGFIESNANKIWNEYTDTEKQKTLSEAANTKQLEKMPDGSYRYISTGEPYVGPTAFLYGYGTDENDDQLKIGVARGDMPSSAPRHSRELAESLGMKGYGWESGVDVNKNRMDMLLPYDVAHGLEGMFQGNKQAIENRRYPDRFSAEAEDFGSGKSEVYNTPEGVIGDTSSVTNDEYDKAASKLADVSKEVSTPSWYTEEKAWGDQLLSERASYIENRDSGSGLAGDSELQQVLAGGAAGAVKGAVDLADAAQELITWPIQAAYNKATGKDIDIDLINDKTKKEVIAAVDSKIGYDRKKDELTIRELEAMANDVDFKITDFDSYKRFVKEHGLAAAMLVAKNPSFTASMISEIMGAGGVLGGATKAGLKVGSKVAPKLANTVDDLLKTNRARTIEKIKAVENDPLLDAAGKAAKVKEAKGTYTLTKKTSDYIKGTTFTNADMAVRIDRDLDEYRKNNNGESADPIKALQIAGVNRLLSNAEIGSLKIAAGVGREPSRLLKNRVANALAKVTVHIGKGVGVEAAQEAMDTIGEQINQKLDSADYEGKTVKELLEDASSEILAATVAGGGSGGHVAAVGALTPKLSERAQPKPKEGTVTPSQPDMDGIVTGLEQELADTESEEARTVDKEAVKQKLGEEYDDTTGETLTEAQEELAKEFGVDEVVVNMVKEKISNAGVADVDTVTRSIMESVNETYSVMEEEVNKDQDLTSKANRLTTLKALKKQTSEVLTERVLGMGMSSAMVKGLAEAGVYVEPVNVEGVNVVGKPLKKDTRTSFLPDSELGKSVSGNMDPTNVIQAITKSLGDASKKVTAQIDSMFNGTDGKKSLQKELAGLVKTISTKQDSLPDSLKNVLALDGKDKEAATGKLVKAMSLGLNNIYSALESEANVAKNAGLTKKEVKDYKPEEVSISSVAPQIGKDYLNSYGLKLRGSAADINAQYTKIGQEILNGLEQLGYIEGFNKNGIAPMPSSFVDTDNQYIKGIPNTELVQTQSKTAGKKTVGYRTTTIQFGRNKNNDLKQVASTLGKAMLPSNFEMVKKEPVTEIPTHDDRRLVPEEEAIIKRFNTLKNSIKPEFIAFLKDIKNSKEDTEFMDALLGTKYNVLDYFEDSTSGFNRGRRDKLRDILDVLEDLETMSKEGFHFSHMDAINHRIHIMETVLDYQGDKFLARNILTGGTSTYTTNNQTETDVIINELADELGVDYKVITGEKITDLSREEKIVAAHVKAYNNNNKNGNGFSYIAIPNMHRSIPDKFKPQAFRWLDLIKTVSDVQRTYDNGKVTTDFMPSFDATASGVVNTLINLSGFKSVQKLVNMLKLKGKTDSIDPYMMVTGTNDLIIESKDNGGFPKELQGLMTQTEFNKIDGDKLKDLGKLITTLNPGNAASALRNIVKYAIMPWFYGQHISNTATTMAESLAKDLITKGLNGNKAANNYISKATGKDGLPGSVAENLNEAEIKQLIESLTDMTREYVQLLPLTFPAVESYRAFTKSIYQLLTATGSKWDTTVATPFQVMTNNSSNASYNMSVKKDKQALLGITEDGIPLIGTQSMPNEISLSVNLQHAIDSYLELIGLDAAMRIGEPERGLQAIHDNIQGTPEKLIASKAVYEKGTVDVAKGYDFINVLIDTVNKAYDGKLQGQNRAKLDSAIANFMEANGLISLEQYNKNKAEYLDSIETDLFGQSVDTTGYETEIISEKSPSKKESTSTPKPTKTQTTSKKPTASEATSTLVEDIKAAIREADTTGTNNKLITLLESISANNSLSENHRAIAKSIVNRLGKVSVYTSQEGSKGSQGKVKIDIDGAPEGIQRLDAHTAETLIETLGHEVEHATTISALEVEANKNKKDREPTYNYIVDKLLPRLSDKVGNIKNTNVRDRILKIINQSSEINRVAEFLAVMRNEPEMANSIIDVIATNSKKEKRNILDRIISYAKELLSSTININPNSFRVDNILYSIETFSNKLAMFEAADSSSKELNMSVTSRNKLFSMINSFTETQNSLVRGLVNMGAATAKGIVMPMVKYLHGKALSNSTMYTATFFTTQEGMKYSPFINKMKLWMRHTENFSKDAWNKLLQAGHTINIESNTLLTSVMPTLSAKLEKTLSTSGMKAVNTLFGQLDMHGLSQSSYMKDILEGKSVNAVIKEIENNFTREEHDIAKSVANYYVNGIVGEHTNLDTGSYTHLKELANLYSLDMVPNGDKTLAKLKIDAPYLYKDLMKYAIAIGAQKLAVNMKETKSYTVYTDFDGNSGMDVYDSQYDFEAVTSDQLKTSKYSKEEGWIIVREAIDGKVGVVARKKIDGQHTPGVGLSSNRFFNGIILDKEKSDRYKSKMKTDKDFLQKNNMVEMQDGRLRIILTKAEKTNKLDLKQNAAQSVLRAYVHNQEVLAMNALRDLVLSYKDPSGNKNRDITANMSVDELETLNEGIKANHLKQDMPMFIKLPNIYDTYESLPPYIKKFYKTPENISSYNNFNQEISLIRRDMADTLLGYKNIRLFNSESPMTLQKMEDGFKKLILMMKLKLVILSPAKLGLDAVSNFMYLTGRNIGVDEIYKYGKEGVEAYTELAKLQTMLVKAKLNNNIKSTKERRDRIRALEKRINNNKFKVASDYGYVQSYSTELMVKDFDTVSGLQKDIDDIVNKITKEKNGNFNAIGTALDKWMKFGAEKGLSVDGLLRAAVSLSRANNTTIGSEILKLSNRLKSVRDSEDVAQYITNIIGGPGSEGVKAGSAFMVGTDAISKYILANALLERINPETGKLYTQSEAYIDAASAFLDQRENPPREIKLISDLTLSFPTFWVRINMVIWNMFRTNPVAATSMAISGEMSGISGSTIIDSNVFNKAMNGTVLNFTNPIQPGTFFPIGF